METQTVTTLILNEENVTYKLYLPYKESDYIQKEITAKLIPYEYAMLQDILKRIDKNSAFLDIGANIGNHSLFLAANGIKVYAFEANKELCEITQKSIELNKLSNNVKIYNYGLSDREELGEFTHLDTSNLGGNALTLGKGDIQCKRLDDFKFEEKIGVIKIDVEGMEEKVLLGAKETIKKNRPLIYIEAIDISSYHRINTLLEALNFSCCETFNTTPTHLYIPNEHLDEKKMLNKVLSKLTYDNYYTLYSYGAIKKLDNKLNTSQQNEEQLKQTITNLKEQNQNLLLKLNTSQQNEEQLKQTITNLKEQNQNLLLKLNTSQQNEERLKNTLSFRWGNRIIKAKSLKKILTLPYDLHQDYKAFKGKIKPNILFTSNKHSFLFPTHNIDNAQKQFILQSKPNSIKVACILDEFSYHCFRYECNLLYLTFSKWESQIQEFQPDFVLIESAWSGLDTSWKEKLSMPSKEIITLLEFCKKAKIPTAFWNKEDPIDFERFLYLAKKVDFIFTSDIDCVAKYKYYAKHSRVYCLPFAAQTKFCNPIEELSRKDGFCFAGSYYMRFPNRHKDFSTIIDAAKALKPVAIYDRNYGKSHAHNSYPQEFQDLIIGGLNFEEIQKAYKGYKFGININSIKNSQTMFARRVFELLASNTIVLSNFSRALRYFFGDLVIASDNIQEIHKNLSPLIKEDLYYRKFRLLGLRKVMSEHTYKDRFSFICSVIFKNFTPYCKPPIYIYSQINSLEEYQRVIAYFKEQKTINNKTLILYKNFNQNLEAQDKNILLKDTKKECADYLKNLESGFFSIFNPKDYYGKSYLTDLLLAQKYSDYKAFGKACFYVYTEKLILQNEDLEYRLVKELDICSSILCVKELKEDLIHQFLDGKTNYHLEHMLALDRFNYCKNGALLPDDKLEVIDDLYLQDSGITFKHINPKITKLIPASLKEECTTKDIYKFSASKLYELFKNSHKVSMKLQDSYLILTSKLQKHEEETIYFKKPLEKEAMNLLYNSKLLFKCEYDVEDLRSVCELLDKGKHSISKSLNEIGDIITLSLPNHCAYIRFGLRIKGSGTIQIKELILDDVSNEPYLMLAKSKTLVLTRQYPSYEDIYKFGFLHTRIKAYKEKGVLVDVFRLNNDCKYSTYEFEGIDVMSASKEVLLHSLQSQQYTHILVHFLDEGMWEILSQFIDKMKIIVWIHGYEIQMWHRRLFNFEHLGEAEINRQKSMSERRKKFWQKVIHANHKNLHFVFVSEHFKNECLGDIGMDLPKDSYSIIHNPINTTLFDYIPKDIEARKKILSIRPFASRKYANDLTVKAILELSNKSFFKELEFLIIGDGELFEETLKPLRAFQNVTIHKKFLRQEEIAKLHKEYGIFLNPTRMDSQGVSRDEAGSSGLVPVTNRVAAIPEFVDEDCGILVEAEDYVGLANAIEFLYKNPKEFLRLSENAAKRVRRQSSIEQSIQREIEIFNGK